MDSEAETTAIALANASERPEQTGEATEPSTATPTAQTSAAEPEVASAEPSKQAEAEASDRKTTGRQSARSGTPTPARAKPRAPRRNVAAARRRRVSTEVVLRTRNLSKRFGDSVAVADVDLEVHAGSFYGLVGPNGAGKTTTLSMITGLLRPDAGLITVHGADVWLNPALAKRNMGVLPDRLRLFDRLTGAQLLQYAGSLRGLDRDTISSRGGELASALGLESALHRMVADYSLGMTKKIALASAMLHAPRVLVLDEPFESVDPVSIETIVGILQRYVESGGTVLLSSHGMDLVQRVCSHVAIMVEGRVLAAGTMGSVRGRRTLEQRFVELAGTTEADEGLEWLHTFSD